MAGFAGVEALTFDLFGTVLDLGGSLAPALGSFLEARGAAVAPERLWAQWRARQRLEQYQDTLLMLGHSGYLETARRALVYVLEHNGIEAGEDEVERVMAAWQELSPFPEVVPALERLRRRYRLVALSNGDLAFLEHLARNRIRWDFDAVFSVDAVGAFKPHPAVYRRAAATLGLGPGACLMVSANSFDVMGARSCGFRGAFVNRYRLPFEDTVFRPDVTVGDFSELAEALL